MDDSKRRIKKAALLLVPVLILGTAMFLLRGPNVSNALKKMVLPELELMLGRRVIAQRIYLNIFPLYIEARGLKVFDDKGERVMVSERVKAYMNISGLFSRRLIIRRLVIKGPDLILSKDKADEIAVNIEKYLAETRPDALKVKVLAVEIQNGGAALSDESRGISVGVRGFDGEGIIGDTQKIRAAAPKVTIKKEGLPEASLDVAVAMLIRDGAVEIKRLTVESSGSRIESSGEFGGESARFKLDLSLLFGTLKKMFNLRRDGEGSLSVSGMITYARKKAHLDLKLKGSFHIQTLMELIEVKERVEGFLEAEGTVKGPIDNLTGKGTAELRTGNLFDVDVDSLKANVSYSNGKMTFSDGAGRFYKGSAKVNASISLPVVDYYTLNIEFSDVESGPLFKLIGWDPGVQSGRVWGTLIQAGSSFNPEGTFQYKSSATGNNVLGRISEVSGGYSMKGQLVTLSGLKLNTGLSDAIMNGTADLEKKYLEMDGVFKTRDIRDLSSPYYTDFFGTGIFEGKIAGPFGDPVVSGKVRVDKPRLRQYAADTLSAEIRYRMSNLVVKDMSAAGAGDSYTMNGTIFFRNAKELFELGDPEYDLNGSVRNADLGNFARLFYDDFEGKGLFRTDFEIRGRQLKPDVRGRAVIDKGTLYGLPFDKASLGWTYKDSMLYISDARVHRGKSVITVDADMDQDGKMSLKAASEKIYLSDLLGREIKGDAVFNARVSGGGTIDRHSFVLKADMIEGRFRDKPVGGGTVSAELKDRAFSARASLMNNRITVVARGRLEKEVPWEADVNIQSGRYDQLISAFLKDVPEDLILSMNGTLMMRGDRKNMSASAVMKQLNLSMYGYSFTNESEIKLDLHNGDLRFERIVMRSGSTSLRMDGRLDIGRKYGIVIEGTSSLSPFKSLSSKIGSLKGDAEFSLNITGDWERPMINGGVNVTNGGFSLKEYPYRISSLNGYLSLENDRVTLEKLTGSLGGGTVDLSGVLYLKKFAINRFYVEAAMKNISATPSSDINVNFDGEVLYKGSLSDQIISGDIKINRARYKQRIEWKSWLLKTKKVEKIKSEISGLEKAALNLRIVGRENISIDNNVARAEVTADLLLRGNIFRPVLYGRIESKEGTVYFRNNEFRILHASSDFSDPNRINPIIQIAAETVVKGYKIKMNLEGRLNQFNMSLSSDPVLKEMDILALLTLGQTGGQLKGLEGGVGAGEATAFVTGKLQDVVEERLKSITGLDRFQVDPHLSRTTGAVEPRVTVSKRLLGEKMFVTYASAVGSAEEQIIKLEYFINKNVSLVGVRDERGIMGGDVQFRFEFK
ncbi:MAG: translocation/assembly module TamB [Nitrospirae bacterium]|nr:translocation/assembly module TamB [Nitrospirota bacterium]